MSTELRFLVKGKKKILQSRFSIWDGEGMSDWKDVPVVDLEKERKERENSPEYKAYLLAEMKKDHARILAEIDRRNGN